MNQSNQRVVNNTLGLLNLADARLPGDGRVAGYLLPVRDAVEHGGVEALLDKTRRKPNFKNRVDEAGERAQHWATPRPGELPQTAQGVGRKSRAGTVHPDRSASGCVGEKETRRRSVR